MPGDQLNLPTPLSLWERAGDGRTRSGLTSSDLNRCSPESVTPPTTAGHPSDLRLQNLPLPAARRPRDLEYSASSRLRPTSGLNRSSGTAHCKTASPPMSPGRTHADKQDTACGRGEDSGARGKGTGNTMQRLSAALPPASIATPTFSRDAEARRRGGLRPDRSTIQTLTNPTAPRHPIIQPRMHPGIPRRIARRQHGRRK